MTMFIVSGFLCWSCLREEDPLVKSLKMVKICITLWKIHFLIVFYLDPSLVPKQGKATIEEENSKNPIPSVGKCLVLLFSIGLACLVESPNERMNMMDVNQKSLSCR